MDAAHKRQYPITLDTPIYHAVSNHIEETTPRLAIIDYLTEVADTPAPDNITDEALLRWFIANLFTFKHIPQYWMSEEDAYAALRTWMAK